MSKKVEIEENIDLAKIEMPSGNTMLISTKALGGKLEFLQDFYNGVLGVVGWSDDLEKEGVLPLTHCKYVIRNLQRENERLRSSLELRDAANGKCKKCGTLHGEPIIHCDVCGAFQ